MERKEKMVRGSQSIVVKGTILFCLMVFLQIPLFLIRNLGDERSLLSESVVSEIQSKWGESVTLSDPLFVLLDNDTICQNRVTESVITAQVDVQLLKRGLYNTETYLANINYQFDNLKLENSQLQNEIPPIYIFLPCRNNSNIKEISVKCGSYDLDVINRDFRSGWNEGILIRLPDSCIRSGETIYADLKIAGSASLRFSMYSDTDLNIKSQWKSPSFDGSILPTSRIVNQDGFEAFWRVNSGENVKVSFINPINDYTLFIRSINYASLIIGLVFLTFFIIEITQQWRIHMMQYILIAAAMIVFYSLLLSFSEHIGFDYSYLIAVIGTVGLITLYSYTILGQKRSSAIYIGTLLSILYLFVYILLSLEEYALMVGSISLFIGIAVTMYALRGINWYSDNKEVE